MLAASPDPAPTLPDGSPPPEGVGRQLLAFFDFMSPGQRKPVGRSRLRSYVIQASGGPVSEAELEQVLGDLTRRGFVMDAPHPGPAIKGVELPEFPGMAKLPDTYLTGEPRPGEACYATTESGAKAAHLCRTLLGQAIATWRLGPDRVHDQVVTALQPSFPSDFARIDAVCCCTATKDVRGAVELTCSWGLVREDGGTYALTPEGEGRLRQVVQELKLSGSPSTPERAELVPSGIRAKATPIPEINRRTAVVLGEVLNEAFSWQVQLSYQPLRLERRVQGALLYDFLIARNYDESFCDRMRELQGQRAVKDAVIRIHTGSFWAQDGADVDRKTLGQKILSRLVRDILREPKQKDLQYRPAYIEPLIQALAENGIGFEKGELVALPSDEEGEHREDAGEEVLPQPGRHGAQDDESPVSGFEPGLGDFGKERTMMGLTAAAEDILRWLRDQYLAAGYPNHRAWTFSPAEENRLAFAELRAHGIIATFGAGGRKWRLTDNGQRMLIAMGKGETQTAIATGERKDQEMQPDPKKVFIIHGRNLNAREQLGVFVRSLGLSPLNFRDLRGSMGGTPTVVEIVERGMQEAQGIIALFTAEEYAAVRPEYREGHDKEDDIKRWQSRPNVIFEAGMAFGRDRKRVVFVLLGAPVLFTDVAGIHLLRPNNKPDGDRATLRQALKSMGCLVEEDSTDWMKSGDLEGCVNGLQEVGTRDPFC